MTKISKALFAATILFVTVAKAQNDTSRNEDAFAGSGIFENGQTRNDTAWNQYPFFYNHPFRTEKPTSFVKLEIKGLVDATGANNNLLIPIALSEPLSRELRAENAERMDERNFAGSEIRAGITFYALNKNAFKKDSLHWFFGYGYRDYASTSFSKDMYKLLMIGNKSLEGDSADLSSFNLRWARYDYLKAGLIKYLPDNRTNISFHVGLARGLRYMNVQTGRGMLYTAPYGTQLNADVEIDARMNRKMGINRYSDINGMGAFVGAEFNSLVGGGAVTVGIDNLGFINWFNGRTFEKDTVMQYSGIYNAGFNFFEGGELDSTKEIFAPQRTDGNFSAALPANIYVQYAFKLKKKGAISLRVDHVFFGPALPSLSGTYYRFFKNSYSAATIQLGGFGKFNVCYDMGIQMKKHFVLLHLYGLEGMVLPKEFGGIGGGLSYAYRF